MASLTSLQQTIDTLKRDLGLTEGDLANALGVSCRSLLRWCQGETFPQHEARNQLESFHKLDERLAQTFDSRDAVIERMHSDNRYLGGIRPVEALRAQRLDAVVLALDALDQGIFV